MGVLRGDAPARRAARRRRRRPADRRFRRRSPWPPLISTARGAERQQLARLRFHFALRCARAARPSSAAASGRLGVITSARGMSSRRSASIASGASSRSPEVATITGSSTMLSGVVAVEARRDRRDAPALATACRSSPRRPRDRRTPRRSARVMKSAGTSWMAGDALRVLRGQRGDDRSAIDAERGEGLQIGLDAGAAARIRAGDGERRSRSWPRPLRQRGVDDARAGRARPAPGRCASDSAEITATPSAPAAITARGVAGIDAGDGADRESGLRAAQRLRRWRASRRCRSAACVLSFEVVP